VEVGSDSSIASGSAIARFTVAALLGMSFLKSLEIEDAFHRDPEKLPEFVCNLDLLEDHLLGKPFDLICGQIQPRDCYPYMEPSYLIWTCCDWIAPVVESRLGLMKTWYTLVTVDRTLPFLSSDCPVTKTRKLRLRVVARL
jgi:hypothetical protein